LVDEKRYINAIFVQIKKIEEIKYSNILTNAHQVFVMALCLLRPPEEKM